MLNDPGDMPTSCCTSESPLFIATLTFNEQKREGDGEGPGVR
jgi:hypothetical protein